MKQNRPQYLDNLDTEKFSSKTFFLTLARSGLLLDSDHADALEKIKYLESKLQRTAEEELVPIV